MTGLSSADRTELEEFLAGDEFWCQGFSEPEAGRDLGSLRTRAVDDGEHWRVTGAKIWTRWAQFAQRCVLLVRTGEQAEGFRGVTALFVDMDSPGITVRPLRAMSGDGSGPGPPPACWPPCWPARRSRRPTCTVSRCSAASASPGSTRSTTYVRRGRVLAALLGSRAQLGAELGVDMVRARAVPAVGELQPNRSRIDRVETIMGQHVADLLDRWEGKAPDREVVRFGERCWTWEQWGERIRRHAGAQLAAGLRPGDRVAFLDKNHPACLETTMACALAGTVSALPNFRLATDEIAYLLTDARARILFVGAEFAPLIEGIRDGLEHLERVIVVGGPDDGYEQWLAGATPLTRRPAAEPDDCFLQLYTSGTTGRPKGAMLTHRGVLAHSRAGAAYFGVDETSTAQVAMPLYHVGGTNWALIALNEGGRVVIDRDVVPAAIADELESAGVTHTFLVPAVLGMLLAQPGIADRDFSALQLVSYGSSPIPAPLLRNCLATLKADFLGLYGMTETSGILTALPREAHRDTTNEHRLASVGRPMPGVELTVRDPATGEEVPTGCSGEVWVRTEQLLSGYANKPEETAAVLRTDGWFRTGDAGKLDAEGYLYLTDRIKDMIISGGENVYPAEVERVLVEHADVGEVAVIGVPDPKWGETPKAIVVPAAGATPDEAELLDYCRRRLARFKCPTSVELVDELPRNPTGKVLKTELRRTFGDG